MKFYRVYKARVVQIQYLEDNKPEIIIVPVGLSGEVTIKKVATPPTPIPTSTIGSGLTSIPDIGQLCLVAETDSEYNVNIITYLQPDGFSSHGVLSGEYNSIGGFVFKTGSLQKSVFSMDRAGRMTLYSDNFARFEVDGSTSTVSMKSKTFRSEYAGGLYESVYLREDPTTGVADLTSSKLVFSKTMENPGFSDVEHFDVEQPASPAPISRYVDKVIIKAGSIANIHTPEEIYNHVYQLETRQSTGTNKIDKDTVTVLRLGYQLENERYSTGNNYPEGTIIEWTAKRNTSEFLSYWNRIGKIKHNLPQEGVKGETYRLQLLSDRRNGLPFGNTTTNPVGQSLGFSTKLNNTEFLNQYSLSLGSSESGDYVGSVKREYIHTINRSGEGYRYWNVLGEGLQWSKMERPDVSHLVDINHTHEYIEWTSDDIVVLTERTQQGYLSEYRNNSTISRTFISEDGAIVEYSKKGNTKIQITDEKITLQTGDMKLELSEKSGLVLNGVPLVYSTLVDFLNQHRFDIAFALGAPAPMSPSALANFNSTAPKGFKTNVGYKTGS